MSDTNSTYSTSLGHENIKIKRSKNEIQTITLQNMFWKPNPNHLKDFGLTWLSDDNATLIRKDKTIMSFHYNGNYKPMGETNIEYDSKGVLLFCRHRLENINLLCHFNRQTGKNIRSLLISEDVAFSRFIKYKLKGPSISLIFEREIRLWYGPLVMIPILNNFNVAKLKGVIIPLQISNVHNYATFQSLPGTHVYIYHDLSKIDVQVIRFDEKGWFRGNLKTQTNDYSGFKVSELPIRNFYRTKVLWIGFEKAAIQLYFSCEGDSNKDIGRNICVVVEMERIL